MVFGAVFTVEANNEYKTITPEMLKEQMPQSTQLFQPNIEDIPQDSYDQYGNHVDYNSHQNGNYNHQSPQPTNYGYWVHHENHRDAMHPMPMHHNYDPEHIGLFIVVLLCFSHGKFKSFILFYQLQFGQIEWQTHSQNHMIMMICHTTRIAIDLDTITIQKTIFKRQ